MAVCGIDLMNCCNVSAVKILSIIGISCEFNRQRSAKMIVNGVKMHQNETIEKQQPDRDHSAASVTS